MIVIAFCKYDIAIKLLTGLLFYWLNLLYPLLLTICRELHTTVPSFGDDSGNVSLAIRGYFDNLVRV